MPRHPGERAFGRYAGLDALIFGLSFGARLGDHGLHAEDQLYAARLAIVLVPEPDIEIIGIVAHARDGGQNREYRLGMLRREIPPAIRGSRLPQNRLALRRRRHEMPPLAAEELTLVIDLMHLGRIGIDAAFPVGNDRIRLPGVPQLVAELHI